MVITEPRLRDGHLKTMGFAPNHRVTVLSIIRRVAYRIHTQLAESEANVRGKPAGDERLSPETLATARGCSGVMSMIVWCDGRYYMQGCTAQKLRGWRHTAARCTLTGDDSFDDVGIHDSSGALCIFSD